MNQAASLMQPRSIDEVRRHFVRALADFDTHAEVFRVVGAQLQERLDVLAIEPRRVLDLGCRSGYQLAPLARRYPEALVIGLDPAPGRPPVETRGLFRWPLHERPRSVTAASDPHRLPLADGSVDLVVSNLLLPFCHTPQQVFREVARVLAPGGAFLFTSAGVDTLREYRARWAAIDSHLHAFGLLDMHELGDSLLAAGFAAPVLDRQNMMVDYPTIEALQQELQGVGAANLACGRRDGLMASSVRNSLHDGHHASQNRSGGSDLPGVAERIGTSERFSVSLELVNGHGWKGELAHPGSVGASGEQTAAGEYNVSLTALRKALKDGSNP